MLDQVLRTQRQTEGRLERLADMQRAMHLLTLDFSQASGSSVTAKLNEVGRVIELRRHAAEARGGSVTLIYEMQEGSLVRDVYDASGQLLAKQTLLEQVAAVEWQFYESGAGWTENWPPMGTAVLPGKSAPNPQAVAVTINLTVGGNSLRRVVLLPAEIR